MTPLFQVSEPDLHHYTSVVDGLGEANALSATHAGHLQSAIDPMSILVICAQHGELTLKPSFIPHPIELKPGEAMFLANPRSPWMVDWTFGETTAWYTLCLPADRFHAILRPGFDPARVSDAGAFNLRDLMKRIPVTPALFMGFDQLLHHKVQAAFGPIFEQAKFLEILSLLLDAAFGQPVDTCPVAMSPAIEQKLLDVRHYVMSMIGTEPDIDELALQFDLPRTTLREGFRFLFGRTVHQYHADHKLEWALQKLTTGEYLVKEVAFEVGYQNPSHFIAAFKKKYGFTPKQYLKREVAA